MKSLIESLKAKQTRLKYIVKRLDVEDRRIISNLYKENRWRNRNDRPLNASDKRRHKEIDLKRAAISKSRFIASNEINLIGDAICRLREIKRGNSKRTQTDVIRQLILEN